MAPVSGASSDSLKPLSGKLSRYLSSTLSIRKLASRSDGLVQRDSSTYNPGAGTIPGESYPNTIIFIIFGLIGAAFIIIGVWFFFRAPNGGFQWKENDWDDYKSTVLRRKGPNGTTLSGATESTDLGGGSIYKDYDGHDVQSSLGSEMSYLKRKIKGKKSSKFTGDKRSKNGKEKRAKLRGGDGKHHIDLEANTAYEGGYDPSNIGTAVDEDIRAYRHEKPARVGGLNKAPDSTQWDGSTAPGTDATSDLLSNQEPTPTKKEKKREYTGGIRKVSNASTSFWGSSKNKKKEKSEDEDKSKSKHHRESKRASKAIPEMSEVSGSSSNANSQRIQDEARRLQELGRAAKNGQRGRRDFSFQYGDDVTASSQVSASEVESSVSAQARREARRRERREGGGRSSRSPEKEKRKSQSPSKRVPGGYDYGSVMSDEDHDGDLGTKSYHHPIPGLSDYLSASGGGSPQASEVGAGSDYAGERRKRRAEGRGGGGGYRRG